MIDLEDLSEDQYESLVDCDLLCVLYPNSTGNYDIDNGAGIVIQSEHFGGDFYLSTVDGKNFFFTSESTKDFMEIWEEVNIQDLQELCNILEKAAEKAKGGRG